MTSKSEETGPVWGLKENRLRPCPSSPNCVCSEFREQHAYVPPLFFKGDPGKAWKRAIRTVQDMGGTIVKTADDYLHAIFTSRIFRFVDDLELRLDTENSTIHLRSASRTGYWDFGVNRRRVKRLLVLFSTDQ